MVLRRLPHKMNEEEFVKALVAAAAEAGMGERGGSWDLMYFTPGKMSKKRGEASVVAEPRKPFIPPPPHVVRQVALRSP